MKNSVKSTIQTIFIMLIILALIAGCYIVIKEKKKAQVEEDTATVLTETEQLLAMDLESDYPLTPRAVLKLYCRIVECSYNESLDDTQLEAMVKQMRLLFDEEFLSNNPFDDHLDSLKQEITDYQATGKTITSYNVESAGNVVEWEADDESYARLIASFTTRQEASYSKVYEEFLFRKDDVNLWRIVGWRIVDQGETESN